MSSTRIRTAIVVLLLVASGAASAGAVATAHQGEAYAGTHIEFETTGDAVVDYTVDNTTVFRSMSVQSQSTAESQGDVRADVGLSAVTDVEGSGLSMGSQTDVSATVTAESGATVEAHDNEHGVLTVRSGGESQYVTVNVSASSQAESESDRRVVVTNDDGTQGAFIIVGDGAVTVNDQGNVSADLGSDSTLVFRSYSDGRSDEDDREEQLIAEGTAAAEVYVMESGEDGGELAADVVQYSEDTAVEVTERSEGTVRMTAERSESEGRVIITSVSEQAISSVEDLQVTVDGEAAAEASSYSELEGALGSDESAFLVRQTSSAEASADVLVAVNEFSTREITMAESGSDGSDGGDDSDDATETDVPGFGPVAALLALVAVAALAAGRHR